MWFVVCFDNVMLITIKSALFFPTVIHHKLHFAVALPSATTDELNEKTSSKPDMEKSKDLS